MFTVKSCVYTQCNGDNTVCDHGSIPLEAPPVLAFSVLQCQVMPAYAVELLLTNAFHDCPHCYDPAKPWHAHHSKDPAPRTIAWNTAKQWTPENVFFRTRDTHRLLPASRIESTMHVWSTIAHWQACENRRGVIDWMVHQFDSMSRELLLLCGMHDQGGKDVAVVATNWRQEAVEVAMAWWAELSENGNGWTPEQRRKRFLETDQAIWRTIDYKYAADFTEVDLVVRALFADPGAPFCPEFIVVLADYRDPKHPLERGLGQVLYRHASFVPPSAVVKDMPTNCIKCSENDCRLIDIKRAPYVLKEGTPMVRWDRRDPSVERFLCNNQTCQNEHRPGAGKWLSMCQRCKDVMYCTAECQAADWKLHKNVCQKRDE